MRFKTRVLEDLSAIERDQRILADAEKGSLTFLHGESAHGGCDFGEDGVCRYCLLRSGPYRETVRMCELFDELTAGIPLEREQLGIYELEVLAHLRRREGAQAAVARSVFGG